MPPIHPSRLAVNDANESAYYKITCGCVRCNPAAVRLEALSWEPRYSCTSQTLQACRSTGAKLPPLRTANLGSGSPSTRQQLVFRSNSEKTDGSGCATARDRTRAPPALLVFVTKPQNRLNSDNPPEGGLLGKRTASHGTSGVKDSEIKAIMGSDCAERKRGQSRCIGKTSSLSSTDGKIFGSSSLWEV